MAHLVKPWQVRWVDKATGKRVKKSDPGDKKKVLERARKWYGVGVPGYGKKRVPLASDKTAARRMLDNLVKAAEQGQAGVPDPDAGRKKLSDHLAAFEQDLALGLATRSKKKQRPDQHQVRLTVQRVRDILDCCRFAHVGDLNDDSPGKLAGWLNWRVGLSRKAGGISHQTAAFYLAAARRFVWWLAKKRAPVKKDLFDELPGFQPANHRKHARRNITFDELARVLEAARAGRVVYRLTGEQRYYLYLTAFATGFRVRELASLTPAHFDLATPAVRLAGRVAKNRRQTAQPLPPGVASQLAAWLVGKPDDQPLWPGAWVRRGAEMLRVDLDAAGVAYSTPGLNGPEFADFHALRHSFVSAMADIGTAPRVLQELARHSDPRLTQGVYTHASREQLAVAVARLPLGGAGSDPFAHLTRDQLVAGLTAAAWLLGWFLAPGATGGATKELAGRPANDVKSRKAQ